uniref:Lipase 3 n=1 Tax=Cacopsylla melanoneura TaxID=428564 RepID=A0A8D8WS60_9HEMI
MFTYKTLVPIAMGFLLASFPTCLLKTIEESLAVDGIGNIVADSQLGFDDVQNMVEDFQQGCDNQDADCSKGFVFPDLPNRYDGASTPEIIRRNGYPVEIHSVTTDDGYILEMHRIPGGKGINRKADPKKKPVFVLHGLLTTSADWVLAGPNISLAFLLADKGYDVWLGNSRGNTYSRKHVKFSTEEYRFWNFSFHEMGLFDAPACIDHILRLTKQDKVSYIGHSMGTTIFFVMASERPEYNDKILVQLSLGPVAYYFHTRSPVKLLAPFTPGLVKIADVLFHGELLSRSFILNEVLKAFCTLNKAQMIFCRELLSLIFGRDNEQLQYTTIPAIVGHDPAGVSTKTILHNAQFINRLNTFRRFDYGLANPQHYNSLEPPDYNISAIRSKVALFYGPNDLLANEIDVKLFYSQLPNPIGLFKVNLTKFSHLDFLWAKDVRSLVYNQLVQIMHDNNQ